MKKLSKSLQGVAKEGVGSQKGVGSRSRAVGDRHPTPASRPLAGKTALITGSTQGLGLATAERLAQAGCQVILNGFGEATHIEAIRKRLQRLSGRRVLHAGADLRHPTQIAAMVALAKATLGSIDILINNAVVRHTGPIEHVSPEEWDESLAVNLSAAFHTIRLVLPMMRAKQWGRIINVSSIYGLRGAANRVGYVTTKTALIGLTRAVALETAGQNVTCNAVCPGTTRTPIHEAAIQGVIDADAVSWTEAERRVLAGKQPTGRLIAPQHVAALIGFLCGPEGGDITGAVFPVDGGWSAS